MAVFLYRKLPHPIQGTFITTNSQHRTTSAGFVREIYTGLDAELPLPEVELSLTLAEIYEGVTFTPEAADES